jgi:hypothetical protein
MYVQAATKDMIYILECAQILFETRHHDIYGWGLMCSFYICPNYPPFMVG